MTLESRKTHKQNKSVNNLWGGRFTAGPAAIMTEINASIAVDQRLYYQDITGSKAHAEMLAQTGIISAADEAVLQKGLDTILEEITAGNFTFRTDLEDIHMNIEARLTERIGPAAGRLHTARSRNDQVATDFRLWVREAIDAISLQIQAVQAALIARAETYAATLMPGYTHLQPAQPVTFGHHLLAYVEMLGRDRGRFLDARRRLNECPLGAAALAGTSFPIDREMTAYALGFDRPTANSMDSVSDRDFALEFLGACGLCALHLSRLAEEIVLWCSQEFRFIQLSDAYTTGSSIMPQKRNPDAAELVRAKLGRIIGGWVGLMNVMKGLPLTYGKDMQEDKQYVFETADSLHLILAAMQGMIEDLQPNEAAMAEAAQRGYITATDLADWLVRVLHLPFRQAHQVTGRIVALAEARGCRLAELSLSDMQTVEATITEDVMAVLDEQRALESRTSQGGTAPALVRAAAAEARRRFLA